MELQVAWNFCIQKQPVRFIGNIWLNNQIELISLI